MRVAKNRRLKRKARLARRAAFEAAFFADLGLRHWRAQLIEQLRWRRTELLIARVHELLART